MAKVTQILTEEDYDRALTRMDEIFQAEIGTTEGDERDALFDLIEEYEDEHYPIEPPIIEPPDIVDKSVEANVQPDDDEPSSSKVHPVLEIIERVKANMPEHLQPEDVPTDAAKNYKHYMYGWPKESER